MRTNIHTHTTFSDGKNTPEEMVLTAIEKGLTAIGISDHGYSPFDDGSIPFEREAEYRTEVRRLQAKYAGRIEIPLGYEHDATYPNIDRSLYDYVIESVHFLTEGGVTMPIDYDLEHFDAMVAKLYGGDFGRMNRAYFESVCRSIEGESGSIVGHIGLTCKYNERYPRFDEEGRDFLAPARDTLAFAVEREKLVEVNTGAISRGWRTKPYPGMTLLKTLREMGGRVLVTGDSHSADALDCAFDDAYAMVKACGFREVWQWKDNGFTAVGL